MKIFKDSGNEMNVNLEKQQINSPEKTTLTPVSYEDFSQKIGNKEFDRDIKVVEINNGMVQVTTELDSVDRKKGDTLLISKADFESFKARLEQERESKLTQEETKADEKKVRDQVIVTSSTTTELAEMQAENERLKEENDLLKQQAEEIDNEVEDALEKPTFDTMEGFVLALRELENDFKLQKRLVKENFWERFKDPLEKDDTKQRMQKDLNKKIDDWLQQIKQWKKEKEDEIKGYNKHNKGSEKKGLSSRAPEINQIDIE